MTKADLLEYFGFRFATNSVHTSRTIMLSELSILMDEVSTDAPKEVYQEAVFERNVLGKRTIVTRKSTFRHLVELYALEPDVPVFRILRKLWEHDPPGRPLLAVLCACGRDSLLKCSADRVLRADNGSVFGRDEIENDLENRFPGRFSEITSLSTAQHLASSWTQSGHLRGKVKKFRSKPVATPAASTYAALLAFISGCRGQGLLDNPWISLLDLPRNQVLDMLSESARLGWLDFRVAGSVVQFGFQHLLTSEELGIIHDQDRGSS